MAEESNTIEVVLRAVNQMSADLAKTDADLAKLQATVGKSTVATERLTDRNTKLQRSLAPLAGGVRTLTSTVAQLRPELAIAITSLDNLAFAMVNAGARGGGFAAIIRAAFNPITFIVLAAVTVIGYLVKSFLEAKEEKEKLDKALRTGDIGFFKTQVEDATIAVDKLVKEYEELYQVQQNVGTAGRAGADLRQKERQTAEALGKALGVQATAEINLAEATRKQAKKTLPDLEQQLKGEKNLIGLKEEQLAVQQNINFKHTLLAKGLLEEDIEYVAQLDLQKRLAEVAQQRADKQRAFQVETLQLDAEILAKNGDLVGAHDKLVEAIKLETRGLYDANKLRAEGLRFVEAMVAAEDKANEERKKSDESFKRNVVDVNAATRATAIQAEILPIQNQLAILQQAIAPSYEKILAAAQKLDELERRALQLKIDQNNAEIVGLQDLDERARKTIDQQVADDARIRSLQTQNGLLDVQKGLIDHAAEAQRRMAKEADQAAGNMARSFLDTFIQIAQATGTDGGVKQAFLNLGATLGKEILEAMLKEIILATALKEVAVAAGNQSIGALLFGQIKGMIPGLGGQPAADPVGAVALDASALNLNTAGTTLNSAGVALMSAATVLQGMSVPSAAGGILGGGSPTLSFGAILEEDLAELDFSKMTDALDVAFGESVDTFGSAMETLFGEGGDILESILGLFSGIGTAISGLFGFAHGGMIFPKGAVQSFARGGTVRNGPVLATVAEEGPELVARMKPARQQDKDQDVIEQRIFIVDDRPGRLGPHDIVRVVSSDMTRGGPTSKAITHVIKRHGR